MESTEPESLVKQANEVSEKIETTVRWFIPGVAFVYSIGFLIVFNFNRKYGITELDLFEAKYVYVGILFVVATLSSLLSISWIAFPFLYTKKKIKKIPHQRCLVIKAVNWFVISLFSKRAIAVIRHMYQSSFVNQDLAKDNPDTTRVLHATWSNIFSNIAILFYFYVMIAFGSVKSLSYAMHDALIIIAFLLYTLQLFAGTLADAPEGRVSIRIGSRYAVIIQRLLAFILIIVCGCVVFNTDPFCEMLYENFASLVMFLFLLVILVFMCLRWVYRVRQAKVPATKAQINISHVGLVLFFVYVLILTFSRCIYPYIPAEKGGGNFLGASPIRMTFYKKEGKGDDVPKEVLKANDHCKMIVLDETSTCFFLANTDDAGGPLTWRRGIERPNVYQIPREAVANVEYLNSGSPQQLSSGEYYTWTEVKKGWSILKRFGRQLERKIGHLL